MCCAQQSLASYIVSTNTNSNKTTQDKTTKTKSINNYINNNDERRKGEDKIEMSLKATRCVDVDGIRLSEGRIQLWAHMNKETKRRTS
jgi:hypothetical protein